MGFAFAFVYGLIGFSDNFPWQFFSCLYLKVFKNISRLHFGHLTLSCNVSGLGGSSSSFLTSVGFSLMTSSLTASVFGSSLIMGASSIGGSGGSWVASSFTSTTLMLLDI